MKNGHNSIIISIIAVVLLSNCSSPFITYNVTFPSSCNEVRTNKYTHIGDVMVFYSEGQEYSGGYLIGGYSENNKKNITGSGTIKVLVKAVSENNTEEYGIEYGNNSWPMQQINFLIKSNGTYCIYAFDGTNSSGSIVWNSSSFIKTGLNEWNELRVDYNTSTRTFSFYINGSGLLLQKVYNNISSGTVSYYTSLRNSTITQEAPYRIEFKTTSPYTYP